MKLVDKIINYISEAKIESAAYVPTAPYTGGLPSSIVKKGSKGTNVKHLQKFLNWCIKAGLAVDGICGVKTVAAIKKYQKQYGLKVDGIFGAKSKSKAESIIAKHAPKPVSKPVSAPASKPVSTAAQTSNAAKLVAMAKKLCWAYGTAEKKWSYKTGAATSAYKTALKKYMKKSTKVAQSDCGYFINTCVRAVGFSSTFLALKGNKDAFPSVPNTMHIVFKGKKIPNGTLKAGDIIRYKKTSGSQHTLMYIGDGKIAEAGRKIRFPIIRKDTKKYNASNVKHNTLQVIRAK